jgi:hypothetical protein
MVSAGKSGRGRHTLGFQARDFLAQSLIFAFQAIHPPSHLLQERVIVIRGRQLRSGDKAAVQDEKNHHSFHAKIVLLTSANSVLFRFCRFYPLNRLERL